MKALGNLALMIGIISIAAAVILRVVEKINAPLGLVPSSFVEFSIACFLLAIAINTADKK